MEMVIRRLSGPTGDMVLMMSTTPARLALPTAETTGQIIHQAIVYKTSVKCGASSH
jgi:hypothetical protein